MKKNEVVVDENKVDDVEKTENHVEDVVIDHDDTQIEKNQENEQSTTASLSTNNFADSTTSSSNERALIIAIDNNEPLESSNDNAELPQITDNYVNIDHNNAIENHLAVDNSRQINDKVSKRISQRVLKSSVVSIKDSIVEDTIESQQILNLKNEINSIETTKFPQTTQKRKSRKISKNNLIENTSKSSHDKGKTTNNNKKCKKNDFESTKQPTISKEKASKSHNKDVVNTLSHKTVFLTHHYIIFLTIIYDIIFVH